MKVFVLPEGAIVLPEGANFFVQIYSLFTQRQYLL